MLSQLHRLLNCAWFTSNPLIHYTICIIAMQHCAQDQKQRKKSSSFFYINCTLVMLRFASAEQQIKNWFRDLDSSLDRSQPARFIFQAVMMIIEFNFFFLLYQTINFLGCCKRICEISSSDKKLKRRWGRRFAVK